MLHPIPLPAYVREIDDELLDSAVGDQHIDYPASVASNQVVALLIAGEKELEKVASQQPTHSYFLALTVKGETATRMYATI